MHSNVQYSLGVGCPGVQGVVTSQPVKTILAMLHSFSTILLLTFFYYYVVFFNPKPGISEDNKKTLSLWATVLNSL